LTNEQKALLISDGSVTSLLEVFAGQTPEIKGIKQNIIKANKRISMEFKIKENDEVIRRGVTLEINKEIIIYAISLAPLSRLNTLKEDFLNEEKPIGKILKEHKIEYRREIFKISIPKDDSFKNFFKNALMREYNT